MNLHDYDFRIPPIDPKTGLFSRAFQEWVRLNKEKKANKVEEGTTGNLAKLTSDGDIADSNSSIDDVESLIGAPFAELSSTKILAYDSTTGLLQNIDLYDWITAGSRLTVTDDGDGTVTIAADDQSININDYISGGTGITITDDGDDTATISVKNQANIIDASESHSISGSDTIDQSQLEAALDAIGAKINEILDLLLASEMMDAP